MSQHDFSIANQTASNARSDINNALQALATNNSGNSAPSTTYANMWWFENDTNLLKIRNEANTAWLNVAYSNGTEWSVLDNTKVKTTSGTQTGLLGDQTTATWTTGTGTTESLVSPAKVKAAAAAHAFTNASANEQGYITFANGIKFVWGYFTSTSDTDQTFNFHSAFPNACWNISLGGLKTGNISGGTFTPVEIVSRTQFRANRDDSLNGTYVFYYLAIGN